MHRLAKLSHHIVGYVYYVVDRADTYCGELSLHPKRGWGYLYILNHPRNITLAKFIIFYFNRNEVFCLLSISYLLNHRRLKLLTEGGCGLSCYALYTKAVYSVAGYLVFYKSVSKSKRNKGIASKLKLTSALDFVENVKPFLVCLRVIGLIPAKLVYRAHHAR